MSPTQAREDDDSSDRASGADERRFRELLTADIDIRIARDGRVKVLDLGIAKAVSGHLLRGTMTKGVMGTPVLAYATRAQAEVVAKGRNAKVYDWKGLTETLR